MAKTTNKFLKDHKPRITTERIAGHKAYWFNYRVPTGGGDHMGFKFSTLGECRDDMREYFRTEMFQRGLLPRVVEINQKPWLITVGDSIGALMRKQNART